MKRRPSTPLAGLVAALLALAWPLSARADIGIPVAAVFWPATWVLFLPVVLIEALVARRLLGLGFGASAKLSLKANAWSTVAGVPLACAWMLVIGLLLGGKLYREGGSHVLADLFFGSAIWLEGLPNWVVFTGPALICVPCYFLSVWIEAWSAAKTVPKPAARRWARVANGITYGVLIGVLLVGAVVTGKR